MNPITESVVNVAKTQVGKSEKPLGSNWGEPVKSYLASVGINFPASWCMAFVYWCITKTGLKNSFIKNGGVLKVWNDTPKEFKTVVPQIGSVFIMDFSKGLGHTGIVIKFDDKYIYTIEGNTNDTGSREGISVCYKQRLRSTIKGYIIIN